MQYVVLLVVLTHQFLIYQVRKKFDVFSIYTLTDIVVLMMFYFGISSDRILSEAFNTDIPFALTTISGIISLYIGIHFPILRKIKESGSATNVENDPRFLWPLWLSVVIFSLCILAIVFQGMRSSGLGPYDYFTKGRLADYLDVAGDQKQEGAFFFVIVQAIRPVCLFLVCFLMQKKRYLQGSFVYLILLAGILAIFKTRLEVIITLAVPVAYFHYYVRRIKPVMFIVAIPLFFFVLTFLDYWRGVGVEDLGKMEINTESAKGGLERDVNAVRGYHLLWEREQKGMLEKEYGANYLYMLLTPVPRFLWADKPVLAFEPRWTSKIFGDFTDGVWIFTAWGEGLAQFGILGVLVNLFLYGLVINAGYTIASSRPYMALAWFYYCILGATYLRGGFQQVFIMTLFYFSPLLIFLYLSKTKIRLK